MTLLISYTLTKICAKLSINTYIVKNNACYVLIGDCNDSKLKYVMAYNDPSKKVKCSVICILD